jgi:uncharacterized small protein (DUF1192 family)
MATYNPVQARLARKRKRQGTLQDVLEALWQAVTAAEDVLASCGGEAEQTMKAVHCLSQAAGQYAKLLEVGELESRLALVEAALARAAQTNG